EITVTELKEKIDAGEDFELIDVRQPDEYAFAKIQGSKLIPLGEIIARKDEIDASKPVIVQCKSGGRSARAIQMLEASGFQADLSNLVGGITAWSREIDPNVPTYN
ncbi:MAG: rhodanese-like domain-containing protein, partial [Pyrinomonadaceae bacterium]